MYWSISCGQVVSQLKLMGLNLGTEYCCIETIKAPNWATQMKNDVNILLTFTNCVMQLT